MYIQLELFSMTTIAISKIASLGKGKIKWRNEEIYTKTIPTQKITIS